MNKSAYDIKVRRAVETDAHSLSELAIQLGYPCDADAILRRLRDAPDDHEILIAEIDGKAAGFIHFCTSFFLTEEKMTEVRALVIHDHFRKCGIGRRLLDEAERWSKFNGCTEVFLYTNVKRDQAHAFYIHCGYSVVKSEHVFRKTLS